MILTDSEILYNREKGNLVIEPFNKSQLNPNSYNITLSNKLLVYDDNVLDMKVKPSTREITIPSEGIVLVPGELYLGASVEYTETPNHVPMLEGRSSIGRLGMFIHITAGFGDVGFKGTWTLEIFVTKPIRVYPGVEVGQLYYYEVGSSPVNTYTSKKYKGQIDPQPSKLYMDFE